MRGTLDRLDAAGTAQAGDHLRQMRGVAHIDVLILPISVQAGIYLIQVPFAAAIRGMQRGRLLFLQYCIFTATSLTGLVIGAATAGLTGAAWGLTTGAAVGLAVFVALYAWAVARVRSGVDSFWRTTYEGRSMTRK